MKNNLKTIRLHNGLSQKDVAAAMSVTQSAVSAWESGRNEPDRATMLKLSKVLGASVDEMYGNREETVVSRNYKRFPVYGYIACGEPSDMDDNIVGFEYVEADIYEGHDIMIATARGDSMSPRIESGDRVIIDRNDINVISGRVYAVQVNGDMASLKVVEVTGDGIDLIPMNPEYSTIHYSAADCQRLPVRILGRLLESRHRWGRK